MGDYKAWTEPVAREVSWTETQKVAIGHTECQWCRVATPSPADSEVIEWAKDHPSTATMWPFEGWHPVGWTQADRLTLCPACSTVKSAAIDQSRAQRKAAS